jgi:hypothetical protein
MAGRAFPASTPVESRRRTAGCNVMLQVAAGDDPYIVGIAGAMDTGGTTDTVDSVDTLQARLPPRGR